MRVSKGTVLIGLSNPKVIQRKKGGEKSNFRIDFPYSGAGAKIHLRGSR